jgi:membrane protein DedA with SNARE-associated domain
MDSMLTDLASLVPHLAALPMDAASGVAHVCQVLVGMGSIDGGIQGLLQQAVPGSIGALIHDAMVVVASAVHAAPIAQGAPVAHVAAESTATFGTHTMPAVQAAASHDGWMAAWIEPYIKYGPWAIMIIFILSGVGLHLSEDLILIPAGILIASGKLTWTETLLAAYVGLVIGDLLWLAMCRRFGTRMVHSRWFKRIIHPRRLLEAKHQMEARGIIVVILARFIPGTRTPVITMAGILHLQWWKLIVVEFSTCAITVPLQVGMGYVAAIGMGEAKSTSEFVIKLVAITAAFVLAGVALHWWLSSRKRAGRAPRSKAAWLRTFSRRRREHVPQPAPR